jgi:hypothetical protein
MHRPIGRTGSRAYAVRRTPPRCIYDTQADYLTICLPPPLQEFGMRRRRAESRPSPLPATLRVEDGLTPLASPGTKCALVKLLSHSLILSLSPAVRAVEPSEAPNQVSETGSHVFNSSVDVSEAVLPEALPDASSVPGWLGLATAVAIAIAARPSCPAVLPSQPGALVTTDD